MAADTSSPPTAMVRQRKHYYPLQAAGCLASLGLIFYGGYYQWPSMIPVPRSGDFDTKMVYTLRCMLPPVLVLAFAIYKVAIMRFLGYAKNPLSGDEALVQKDKNFVQNTLEQLAAFTCTTLALVSYLEGEEMRLIPLYCLNFVLARILYRIGYPTYRSWGFFMTIISYMFVSALTAYFMVTRGFTG